MPQKRMGQHGTFHITTNTQNKSPWCTLPGVPEILIDNLRTTRNLHDAEIIAFCILPEHMHIVLLVGAKGLTAFMHSFKRSSSKDVRFFLEPTNEIASFTGWQRSFHDERVRNEQQLQAAMHYVLNNAMNHGLANTAEE